MSDARNDASDQVDVEGSGRREFLKKAGKIAFVVPAIQVLSMAPAGAQSNGSVVTTSMPPGSTMPPTSSTSTTSSTTTSSTTTSSTTSSTTTTTEAPCDGTRYRLKANLVDGAILWTTGVFSGDCLSDSSEWDDEALPGDVGMGASATFDDDGNATVVLLVSDGTCTIEKAAGRTLLGCQVRQGDGGPTLLLTGETDFPLEQFEVIVLCCDPT